MHESKIRHNLRGRFLFSTKELLFLTVICVTGAFLFSGAQENAKLLMSWELTIDPTKLFENNDFPLDHERL